MFWTYERCRNSFDPFPIVSTLFDAASKKIVNSVIKPDINKLSLPPTLLNSLTVNYEKIHFQQKRLTIEKIREYNRKYDTMHLKIITDIPLDIETYNMLYNYPEAFNFISQPNDWKHLVHYYWEQERVFTPIADKFNLCHKCLRDQFAYTPIKKIWIHEAAYAANITKKIYQDSTMWKKMFCSNCIRTPLFSILTEVECQREYDVHYLANCVEDYCKPPEACVVCTYTTLKYIKRSQHFENTDDI